MMNDMMKNLKANQEEMEKKLRESTVKADSGSGEVTVKANGKCEILNIAIDHEKIDLTDHEALEDLILVTINRAIKLAQKEQERETQKSLNSIMPGGLSGLFG